MVDPKAAEFFRREREKDSANMRCADCGTEDAAWASISHGIYLSIGASGVHRSLGVRVSFVQSTTMDSWKPVHLRMMELGGNRRFAEFLREHGIPEEMPLRQKYRTRAAEWYRENLRAEAEEAELPAPLLEGTGHLPSEDGADGRMGAMLDEVFSAAPHCSQMTRGGVPVTSALPAGLGQQHPAVVLVHNHHRRSRDASRRSKKVTSFPDWVSKQIDRMTTSKGARAAEKLKTMSTGSMPGFGPEDSITIAFRDSAERLGIPQQAAVAA